MARLLAHSALVLVCVAALSACADGDKDPVAPVANNDPGQPDMGPGQPDMGGDCFDRDGDGFGRGSGRLGADCDDTDRFITTDCGTCTDMDGDGYGEGNGCRGPDCDDSDPNVNPAAVEVPGDGKDNDCVGGDLDCVDMDGDGFGEGAQCRGPDCDDTDRNVRPGAREICGNMKDDDCEGGDEACAEDCVDADGDQHGEGAGCLGTDCDEMNPNVNSSAMEVCNGTDDNCDGTIDECPGEMSACDPNRLACVTAQGGACQANGDCLTGLICEGNVCRGTVGVPCEGADDCSSDFICMDGMCATNPDVDVCEMLDCEAGEMVCLEERGECVACIEHVDCPGIDLCAGFACFDIPDREFSADGNPLQEMAQFLADCFNLGNDDNINLCGIIDAESLSRAIDEDEVFDYVCDDATPEDFVGGERDLEAAEAVVGCGLFNDDDLTWEQALQPGSFWEICMWTIPPAIFFDERSVIVEDCTLFPVEE